MPHGWDETQLSAAPSEAQQLFAALAHTVVLEVLMALHDSPAAVTVLAQKLEYDVSAISRRLASLVELDLVKFTRVGRSHIYQLTPAVHIQRTRERGLIAITTTRGTMLQIAYEMPRH